MMKVYVRTYEAYLVFQNNVAGGACVGHSPQERGENEWVCAMAV